MKRRDILKAGAGSLAATGLWSTGAQAGATAAGVAPAFAWSLAAAAGLVGQPFWLNHPELRALSLTLLNIDVPEKQLPQLSQFTLVFGTRGPAFNEGTYELEHAAIGRFELHLAPGGPARYRAVFNLLA